MRILIVEDEENTRIALGDMLARRGFQAVAVPSAEEALEELERERFDVMLTDLRMPDMDGIELARRVKQTYPMLFVLVVTAYGTIENAVEAVREGIYDYLIKPVSSQILLKKLNQLDEMLTLREEVGEYRRQFTMPDRLPHLVGQDSNLVQVIRQIQIAAASDSTVLITGETGTGKELVARTIHGLGSRKDRPFVAVHCAAYSEQLIESELFGHSKGAFTGAVLERKGKIRSADGGTLFLDEVNSIAPGVQTKLLRVIQERSVEPVGSDRPIPVDIRIIAASNEELEPLIKSDRFRSDLYYRLNVLRIHVPPLRARQADIPLLVNHFIRKKAPERSIGVSAEVMDILIRHPWYGNVRELDNCVEVMLANCKGDLILPRHLPQDLSKMSVFRTQGETSLGRLMDAFEKFLIVDTLKQTEGRMRAASRRLKVAERTLERKVRKHHLRREMFRTGRGETKGAASQVDPECQQVRAFLHAPDGIVMIGQDLRVLAMNQAVQDLTGWSPTEVVGQKRCVDFMACRVSGGDSGPASQCSPEDAFCLKLVKEDRAASGVRLDIRTKNNRMLTAMVNITPLHLRTTEGTGLVTLSIRKARHQKDPKEPDQK